MELKILKIHNIASIEDATIDFKSEILRNSGVFLISGNTGSGKTTILDAICLALFAQTPRMESNRIDGSTADCDQTIKTDDVRQLLRRNTGEGYVSLSFMGSDKKDYEASIVFRRARNNPEGKLQSKSRELKELSSGTVWRKEREIQEKINSVIGLDFSQFCRTTMLAQGEFTRFLNSKDEEKAVILEKITGVGIYSRIGAKIFELQKKALDALEAEKKKVESLLPIHKEEMEALEKEYDECLEKKISLSASVNSLHAIMDWFTSGERLKKDISDSADTLIKAKQEVESIGFRSDETTVAEWRKTAEPRQWKSTADTSRKAVEKAQRELSETARLFASVCCKKEIYENNAIKKIEDKKELIDKQLAPQLDKLNKEIDNIDKEITQHTLDSKKKSKELDALDMNGISATYRECTNKKELLNKVSQSNETLADATEKNRKATEELNAKRIALKEKREETERLSKVFESSEKVLTDAENLYNRQKATVDDWAKNIRMNLHIGDTCPVCNRVIETSLPSEEDFKTLMRPVEDAYRKALDDMDVSRESLMKANAELKVMSHDLDSSEKKLRADNTLAEARNKFDKALKNAGISATGNIDVMIRELQEKNNLIITNVSEKLEDCNRLRKEINFISAETEMKRNKRESAHKKISLLEKKISETNNDIKSLQELLENNSDAFQKSVNDIAALKPEWDVDAIMSENPSLSRNIAQNTSASEILSDLTNVKSSIMTCDTIIAEKSDILAESVSMLESFLKENGITSARMAELSAMSDMEIAALEKSCQKKRDKLTEANASVKTLESQRIEWEKNRESLGIDEKETKDSYNILLAGKEKEQEINLQRIGAIDTIFKNEDEKSAKIAKAKVLIERLESTYVKWERLNSMFGSQNGAKFRRIAQSYVLESLVRTANGYMRKLAPRYRLYVSPGSFVISVEDSYMGYDRRAGSLISGGESFLVSLALALALADIGNGLAVDTLFIDEGFGTLSGEHLQRAIDTLRSLHRNGGRTVGVISHVEELRERIPAQIRVEQAPGESSSRVTVV